MASEHLRPLNVTPPRVRDGLICKVIVAAAGAGQGRFIDLAQAASIPLPILWALLSRLEEEGFIFLDPFVPGRFQALERAVRFAERLGGNPQGVA